VLDRAAGCIGERLQVLDRDHGHGRVAAALDDDPFLGDGYLTQEVGEIRPCLGGPNRLHGSTSPLAR